MLSISLKSSRWVGVQGLVLRLFGAMVCKLLIIEPFSQWKINKVKIENYITIWGCSWCCPNALDEADLLEFISQFSELRCERDWFLSGFCCWKFKQIAKIGFGRKNQLSPQYVHTWANSTSYSSHCENVKLWVSLQFLALHNSHLMAGNVWSLWSWGVTQSLVEKLFQQMLQNYMFSKALKLTQGPNLCSPFFFILFSFPFCFLCSLFFFPLFVSCVPLFFFPHFCFLCFLQQGSIHSFF